MAAAAAILAAGCMKTDQRLVLKADGSGSLESEIELIPQAVRAIEAAEKAPQGGARMTGSLPLTEEAVRKLGETAAGRRAEGVRVTRARVERTPEGGAKVSFRIDFTDVHAFASSKAAEVFQFDLERRADGSVRFTTPLLASRNMLIGAGRAVEQGGDEAAFALEMTKLVARGATLRVAATLPGRVGRSNATDAEGSRAVWRREIDGLAMEDVVDEEKRVVGAWAELDPEELGFRLPVRARRAGAFAPGGEPAVEAADAEPPPPGEVRFRVEPATASVSRRIEFKDGRPEKTRTSLSLQLSVFHPAGVVPVSYTWPEIERATADTGEELAREGGGRLGHEVRIRQHRPFFARGGDERPQFRVHLSLKQPDSHVGSLRRLKGSFTVKYAGRTRKVEVSNPRERVGTRLDVEGLGDAEVHLEKIEPDSVTLRVGKKSEAAMGDIEFLDGAGDTIRRRGSSSRGDGEHTTTTYNLALPDDGRIVFTIHEDVRQEPVTFDFKDLSLGGKAEVAPPGPVF